MAVAPHSVSAAGTTVGSPCLVGDVALLRALGMPGLTSQPRCLMCVSLSPVGPCTPGGQGWGPLNTARSWGRGGEVTGRPRWVVTWG